MGRGAGYIQRISSLVRRVAARFPTSLAPLVVVCITAILGDTCYAIAREALEENLHQKAEVLSKNLGTLITEPLVMGEYNRMQNMIHSTQQSDGDIEKVTVIGDEGEVLASTAKDFKPGAKIASDAIPVLKLTQYTTRTAAGNRSFDCMMPIQSDTAKAMLQMTISRSRIEELLQRMQLRVILSIILASVISWSLVKRVDVASKQVKGAVKVLGDTVSEIVEVIGESMSSSRTTASAVYETTSIAAELKQTSLYSSSHARNVFDTARRSQISSESGREAVEKTTAGMLKIRAQMDVSGGAMVNLLEKSRSIAKIIGAVDDLSRQSALLSINAAIEAAKAGEHAVGFTAIATEMKQLSTQSKSATSQIRAMLRDIQTAATDAARATQLSSEIVDEVVSESHQASQSIVELSLSVSDCSHAANQIAQASEQQVDGADQVVSAMQGIEDAASQNIEVVGRLEVAGKNLSTLESQLSALIKSGRA